MKKKSSVDFDVIVVGFGTAGAVAAIAAARLGARVLVLERSSYAGGTQSGGGIPGFYGGPPPYGLTSEIDAKIKAALAGGGYGGDLGNYLHPGDILRAHLFQGPGVGSDAAAHVQNATQPSVLQRVEDAPSCMRVI